MKRPAAPWYDLASPDWGTKDHKGGSLGAEEVAGDGRGRHRASCFTGIFALTPVLRAPSLWNIPSSGVEARLEVSMAALTTKHTVISTCMLLSTSSTYTMCGPALLHRAGGAAIVVVPASIQ